jgi:hypothetical protein
VDNFLHFFIAGDIILGRQFFVAITKKSSWRSKVAGTVLPTQEIIMRKRVNNLLGALTGAQNVNLKKINENMV